MELKFVVSLNYTNDDVEHALVIDAIYEALRRLDLFGSFDSVASQQFT